MDIKMKLKDFWRRSARSAKGFTLVELIIVIAILAILAGIAVPAYSGYVEKTNKAADQTLIGEVEHALSLRYYANSDSLSGTAMVELTQAGASSVSGDEFISTALSTTFGEGWENTLALKYDGWSGSYEDSSFSGVEGALLTKVDTLTSKLDEILASHPALLGGTGFESYLAKLNIDTTDESQNAAVADAAVLYVAQNAAQMTSEQRNTVIETVAGLGSLTDPTAAVTSLTSAYGSSVSAAAGLYAVAEAYCQYEKTQNGNSELLEILNEQTAVISGEGVTNGPQAVQKVMDAFTAIMTESNQESLAGYFASEGGKPSQAAQDAEAYLDILTVVAGAEDELIGSLGQDNCFSNQLVSDMFNAIADGNVLVWINVTPDGFEVKNSVESK